MSHHRSGTKRPVNLSIWTKVGTLQAMTHCISSFLCRSQRPWDYRATGPSSGRQHIQTTPLCQWSVLLWVSSGGQPQENPGWQLWTPDHLPVSQGQSDHGPQRWQPTKVNLKGLLSETVYSYALAFWKRQKCMFCPVYITHICTVYLNLEASNSGIKKTKQHPHLITHLSLIKKLILSKN